MALVGNKADLQEKREVSVQVSMIFLIPLISSSISAIYILMYLVTSVGWNGICGEEWNVLYRDICQDSR